MSGLSLRSHGAVLGGQSVFNIARMDDIMHLSKGVVSGLITVERDYEDDGTRRKHQHSTDVGRQMQSGFVMH